MIRTRVNTIITRFKTLNDEMRDAINDCTQEQWQTIVPEEERAASVMFHHIVSAYPYAAGWAIELATKEALPPITMEDIHEINKKHADQFAKVTKEEVLRAQRENVALVIQQIHTLSDEQMDITAPFSLMGGKPVNVHGLLTFLLVTHGTAHFEALKTAVNL